MKTTYLLIIAITTILFHLTAGASEREPDYQTINNIFKNDRFSEGFAKGVAATALTVCGIWPVTKSYIWPATVGLFTWSRPRWNNWENCWEDDK